MHTHTHMKYTHKHTSLCGTLRDDITSFFHTAEKTSVFSSDTRFGQLCQHLFYHKGSTNVPKAVLMGSLGSMDIARALSIISIKLKREMNMNFTLGVYD